MSAPPRASRALVDLDALEHNFETIRRQVGGADVMPVVKADAYGHGAGVIGRLLDELGVGCLAVALVEEAVFLRSRGIETDILVFGHSPKDQLGWYVEHNLLASASTLSYLHDLESVAAFCGRTLRVHAKVDTGMARLGARRCEAPELFELAVQSQHLDLAGVYSHLACADEPDLSHARTQVHRLQAITEFFAANGLEAPMVHIANSAGVIALPESHLDAVRPGLMLYGVSPLDGSTPVVDLRPVLSLESQLTMTRPLGVGDSVSYGSTWTAHEPCHIGVVPLGYADGFPRSLSNSGGVLIDGRRRRVVGRVCMDQFMVDLGGDTATVDSAVVLIGSQGGATVTAWDLARSAQTIPYEILTGISPRVPRVYHRSGRPLTRDERRVLIE